MANAQGDRRTSVWTWLVNPFHYVAGGAALGCGLAVMALTAVVAWAAGCRFDGVLDFHPAPATPWWGFVLDAAVGWLPFSALLYAGGVVISRSRVRALDVFGVQALARWPALLMALAALLPGWQGFLNSILEPLKSATESAAHPAPMPPIEPAAVVAFAVVALVSLLGLVWMVALMYRGFSVSCNVRGGKAIGVFIACVILGEAVAKFALWYAS